MTLITHIIVSVPYFALFWDFNCYYAATIFIFIYLFYFSRSKNTEICIFTTIQTKFR